MDKILLDNITGIAGIIFNDTFSYKLKFFQGYYIPFLKEDLFSGDLLYKMALFMFLT